MEPLLPGDPKHSLADRALILVAEANALAGQLNPIVRDGIGDLVRSMNCYYSNLIEGHQTLPHDIDRALTGDYSTEPEKRDLQLEAVAHIAVQQKIDVGEDIAEAPVSRAYLRWLHFEFCSRLPDELLWMQHSQSQERVRVEPGEFRSRNVIVGQHVPPAPEVLDEFLQRFETAYSRDLSRMSQLIAIPAAHHRLLWIHPFLDGNGRVARLMAHAMLKRSGVGSSLWSVSRGLARRVSQYKSLLMAADQQRRGDVDGRGNLSDAALREFCEFFFDICTDQVRFMSDLLKPDRLAARIEVYCAAEEAAGRLRGGSFAILREIVLAGEVERGRAATLTGFAERWARMTVKDLLEKKLVRSPSPRAPLRLNFPIEAVERWFPNLYL